MVLLRLNSFCHKHDKLMYVVDLPATACFDRVHNEHDQAIMHLLISPVKVLWSHDLNMAAVSDINLFLKNSKYHTVLSILKGFRNGVV